jgi:hypothetical protein
MISLLCVHAYMSTNSPHILHFLQVLDIIFKVAIFAICVYVYGIKLRSFRNFQYSVIVNCSDCITFNGMTTCNGVFS